MSSDAKEAKTYNGDKKEDWKAFYDEAAPVFYPLCASSPEMQGFGGSTYRPSYRHPGVATCSLGNPGPIPGSAATGTARSAVGGSFQTFLAEHRARATGVSL